MSILQNKRYDGFEEKIGPDLLRGEAPKNFPWTLVTEQIRDKGGDLWMLESLCLNLIPNDVNNELEAHLQFRAQCRLPEESMSRLGFNAERLVALDEQSNSIEVVQEIKLRLEMTKLETICKNLLARFGQSVIRIYSDERKKNIIRKRLTDKPFCRFTQ